MAEARAFTEVEPAAFSQEIDVNLKGTLNATKVVIGDMTAAGSGTIINVSSVSDRKTSEAVGMQGVCVINVAPAYIRTNIHQGMGINFEEYCRLLGSPDFLSAEVVGTGVLNI